MKTTIKHKEDWAALVLRVVIAGVMFPHGAQKLLGWYGGYGYGGTMQFFTGTMGLPAVIAFLVIVGESFGSLAMLLGFMTRFTAASFIAIMLGAIGLVHGQAGFFMNWFGNQKGEGFEYHLLVIGISAALMILGGGKWSVDRVVARRLERLPIFSGKLAYQEGK
ncbi:MAG TPA: DoxX family protein [Candidatus Manganitrophaceae bacterium]|nr:DoxX family protein [Candidatus Manganitrophaceae bacterium]